MKLARLVFGRRLANREARTRRMAAWEAVPALGLDALGSAAYGPEAALAVLAPLGAIEAGRHAGAVLLPVIALLAILYLSYLQTIRAYPQRGGAYFVAARNLGTRPALLAAAALMVDYVLNVTVGISAGVGVLVSLAPSLHGHMTLLCLGVLALITAINLRGTPESGRAFAVPTYAFVASFLAILAIGVFRTCVTGGHPRAEVLPPALPATATGGAGVWLLLRAFAAGCAAMTGIEAVSNGMTTFRAPPIRHGTRTLTAIAALLGLLLTGVAVLVPAYGVGAMDQTRPGYRTVLSQLAAAVVGDGVFYQVSLCALVGVLTLSANTSFVAFPRLCRNVAEDGFLPRPFALSGRRLVLTVGVLYLAVCAGALLFVFDGITDRLIPLFAIGAFLSFSLSQIAMVAHWRRNAREAGDARETRRCHTRGAINAVGAAATLLVLAVVTIAKFGEGAWITLLVIPGMIGLLLGVRRYYRRVEALSAEPLPLRFATPLRVLVVVERWDRLAANALEFGLALSPEVEAVHLVDLDGPSRDTHLERLRHCWHRDVEMPARGARRKPPRLRILEAPCRVMHAPLLALVRELEREQPERRIAVLIPEIVRQHWYQILLHGRRAQRLRASLLREGGPCLTVVSVPWYVEPPRPPVGASHRGGNDEESA